MVRFLLFVAFFVGMTGGFVDRAQAQRLLWLGTLGGDESAANGVADNGVVVGWAQDLSNTKRAFRWTEATGMDDLGALVLLTTSSIAYDVSDDGTIIVGESGESFRWTETTGMQEISFLDSSGSSAYSVSGDGSVIVGASFKADMRTPYRWTEADGIQVLFEPTTTLGSNAFDVSDDGAVIVGSVGSLNSTFRPFRWTETTGVQDLGTLGGDLGVAYGVSADGSVVVGSADNREGNKRPFRWTASAGMIDLTSLGQVSEALDVSANGLKMVGYYVINNTEEERALLWNFFPVLSIRNLNSQYADLISAGSYLERANAISANGRYIVGYGFNAETGRREAFLLDTNVATGVEDETVPQTASLAAAFPNPFRLSTTLGFTVSRPGPVRLCVYDGLGRLVRTLVDAPRSTGAYQVDWDGRDEQGRIVPAGVYLVRLEDSGAAQTRTLVVVR